MIVLFSPVFSLHSQNSIGQKIHHYDYAKPLQWTPTNLKDWLSLNKIITSGSINGHPLLKVKLGLLLSAGAANIAASVKDLI